jgi:S1-C subfamily serine protease
MPSVALVHVEGRAGGNGVAIFSDSSGFVIDQRKQYVLTSCHLFLPDAGTISVQFGHRRGTLSAEMLRCDKASDLAILHVAAPSSGFPPALIPVSPGELHTGEDVYALGFVSISPIVIPGTVKGLDVNLTGLASDLIQTHSNFEPSTSNAMNVEDALHDMSGLYGGPLVNRHGRLVGVNAYSSQSSVKVPLTGNEINIPKGTYYARTLRAAAPLILRPTN